MSDNLEFEVLTVSNSIFLLALKADAVYHTSFKHRTNYENIVTRRVKITA